MPLNVRSIKVSDAVNIIYDNLVCDADDTSSTMLHGSSGIGKSAVPKAAIARATEKLGGKYWLGVTMLSQMDQVDLRGLPVVDHDNGVTKWLTPNFFPVAENAKGILFLDEFNSAPQSVMAAAYQLLLDRRLGDYVVPAGVRVVAAGNMDSDKAIVSRTSTAARNRLQHFQVVVDLDEWVVWALQNGVPPEVVSFLRLRNSLLHQFDPSKDLTAFPTPRTWEMVAKFMRRNSHRDLEGAGIAGCVGDGAAAEFAGFLRIARNLPSIDTILLDPKRAPVPEKADAQYAIAGALAFRATKDNLDRVVTYLARMPAEFSALTMRDALTRDSSLQRSRAFIEWATRNKSFLF